MYRSVYNNLKQWKLSKDRKPLVLSGARQIGKTYILKEFGKSEFKKLAFFSLDRELSVRSIFENTTDTHSIMLSLSAISGVDITPKDTLIVLDEIQDCPKALEALKYFSEDASEYFVAVAGSLLGISLHNNISFPVGKIDMIRMFPMDFCEFLEANGKTKFVEVIMQENYEVLNLLSTELQELLRMYYYVGGMPAVVKQFVETRELTKVRALQNQILFDYSRDFSKHAPQSLVPRINLVWNSIPSQLSKENKKFVYGALKHGARASEFELAIQWLIDAGLIYKVNRVSVVKMPLKFYEDMGAFKLFLIDVGLMGALADTSAESMLVNNNIFSEYKGMFTELFVASQMISNKMNPFYYSSDDAHKELDFVIQGTMNVFPIEVKAEENVHAKSLKAFLQKNPNLKAVRISMKNMIEQENLVNVPLYAFIPYLKRL